jgi:hypothetical protein
MAMALLSRQEATGRRLPKPAVPGDRIIVSILKARANQPRRTTEPLTTLAGDIAAAVARKMAKPRHSLMVCPLFSGFTHYSRY